MKIAVTAVSGHLGAEIVRALTGVDTLLLVSGMDAPDKRIEQQRNVIRAAREAGVKNSSTPARKEMNKATSEE